MRIVRPRRGTGGATHETQQILVVGGTRGTGLLIVKLLLREGYGVRVLTRNRSQAAARLGPAVELAPGDITSPETLPTAVRDVTHIIFTAGVPTGLVREERIIATEYRGVLNTLGAAHDVGFSGRFLYMTAIGGSRPSLSAAVLNLVKGNTLRWRTRVEEETRASGVDYTIIRAGVLLNRPGGRRAVIVSQAAHPLAPWYRIARADVAEVFVEALKHPSTSRTTFEVVWGRGPRDEQWDVLFRRLTPDA